MLQRANGRNSWAYRQGGERRRNADLQCWVGGGLRGKARQIAVVNLIAAAPELLVACKALSDLYTHAWDVTTGGLFMNSASVEKFEAAHAQAVDAIAKATGKAVRS